MFKCKHCNKEYSKWQGKCDVCEQWNTLYEIERIKDTSVKSKNQKITPLSLNDIDTPEKYRLKTNISEIDLTLGGGIIKGQVILLAGSPGVGKSTLLLTMANKFSLNKTQLYVAGEESIDQIKDRALRLKLDVPSLKFIQNTNVNSLEKYIHDNNKEIDLIFIDSIQTLYSNDVSSPPGSISQVIMSTEHLVNIAKNFHIPIIIVGHITKSGNIAGPKTLEHIVDTVLYFEGDQKHEIRVLRVEKNRFGPTDTVGLFKMTKKGLKEITDPKELYQPRSEASIGSVFTVALEGNRPLIVEIQALATKSYFELPRRTTSGFDKSRLNILLALADKLLRIKTYQYDIYVNVTGGISIKDPAIDLAVLKAIISSIKNEPINPSFIYFGEVGLTGEIRKVLLEDKRINEAKKLGFRNIISRQTISHITKLK
jgi:DNA repair protein RadA/Sms